MAESELNERNPVSSTQGGSQDVLKIVNDYSHQLEAKSSEIDQITAKFNEKKSKLQAVKKERNELRGKL